MSGRDDALDALDAYAAACGIFAHADYRVALAIGNSGSDLRGAQDERNSARDAMSAAYLAAVQAIIAATKEDVPAVTV